MFPDQGSNLCPLHWQMDPWPLCLRCPCLSVFPLHHLNPLQFFPSTLPGNQTSVSKTTSCPEERTVPESETIAIYWGLIMCCATWHLFFIQSPQQSHSISYYHLRKLKCREGKSFPQDCIARNWLSQYSLPICNRGCTPSSVTLYWPHSFVSKALKRSMPSAHLKRNNLRCAQKFSHGASCILV